MYPFVEFRMPSYALWATIGVICAVTFLFIRAEKFNISFKKMLLYIVSGGIFLLIGSRVFFIIGSIPNLIKDFEPSKLLHYLFHGGIVFYGGMFGFLFGILMLSKKLNDSTDNMLSYFVPAIPLFHIFGRIGCFFSGCCYGIPCNIGFPMAFDPQTIRFPVQLAESTCNICIFLFLVLLENKKSQKNILSIYLLIYAICRFCLEFLRDDSVRGIWGNISTAQIISIAVFIIVVAKYCRTISFKK